jgi:trigger factor
LETSVEQLQDDKVAMTVTIEASEVDEKVDEAYKEAAKVRIPGFRPGKAPRRVLENNYGGKEYFLSVATEELVRATAPRAVDDQCYVPLAPVEFEDLGLVEEGSPFTYKLTVQVTPRLELSSYDPVTIESPGLEPTEEEIAGQIESLRKYYVSYDEVTDRPVQEGDVVALVLGGEDTAVQSPTDEGEQGSSDAAPQGDAPENAISYEIGSMLMPEEFEAGLVGMEIGETKEIVYRFGAETEAVDGEPEAADATAEKDDATDSLPESISTVVTIKGIKTKNLPEVTDAWVKQTMEYEGVEELKRRFADSMREQKESALLPYRESRCSQELAARLVGEVPAELVKQTEKDNYQDFYKMLQKRRMTLDQYLADNEINATEFSAQMKDQADKNARAALALDALARHLGFTVSDEDLLAEFEKSGVSDPKGLYEEWQRQGRLSEIREGILRTRAAQHLIDTAEILEPGSLTAETPA